jgi:hypothetical protein
MPFMSPVRVAIIPAILLAGGLAGACSKSSVESSASTAAPAATSAEAPLPPPTAPPPMPAHEPTGPAPAAMAEGGGTAAVGDAAVPTATGKVLETMDAGGYTYVRLDTGRDTIWVATAPIAVKVGQLLTVPLEMPMENFHAAKLGRDFPLIYFASRVSHGREPLPPRPAMPTAAERAAAGQAPSGSTMPPGHPPVGAGAAASVGVTEVIAPPTGGLSVADLWARRAALAGTRVVVRGKVVKFLGGIMGRNWLHLQDGTGSAKDGTHDVTVTTDGDAKPGDVVTATGTLAIDKDFGAGYKYGAIVESATLSK